MARPSPLPRAFSRLLAGLVLLLWLAAPGLALAASGKFLAFSDLHFNPFADQSLVAELTAAPACEWEPILSRTADAPSTYNQEANYALFVSTLADMRLVEPNPDFLIFTGDILAHNFGQLYQSATGDSSQSGLESFIAKTVTFFAWEIEQHFPGIPVFISLGNNDAYEGDYLISAGGSFLKDTGDVFGQHFFSGVYERNDFLRQYPTGGYYSLTPSGESNIRIISLNSVFFSVKRQPGAGVDPGTAELDWLEGQLKAAQAAGGKIYLLSHIPPGANVFNTIHDSANTQDDVSRVTSFWSSSHTVRYLDLMERYSDNIVCTFAGHTHMDDFRLVMSTSPPGKALAYLHITPATSPQFGNNPAFQVFTYDPASGALLDFTTHYLDVGASLPLWRGEYSFLQAYGQAGITSDAGRAIFDALAGDQRLRDAYTTQYKAGNRVSPFRDSEFKAYWCGIANLRANDYQNCYNCQVRSSSGGLSNSCAR